MSENQTEVKKLKIDPIAIFNQIEELRKEGMDEASIKIAFVEYLDQVQGNFRERKQAVKSKESVPMPTHEELMKLYEERYKGINDEDNSPEIKLILEAMENAKKFRETPKVPLRKRIAVYFVRKALQGLIFLCKVLGVR